MGKCLEVYHSQTAPLVKFYSKSAGARGDALLCCVRADGIASLKVILETILDALDALR